MDRRYQLFWEWGPPWGMQPGGLWPSPAFSLPTQAQLWVCPPWGWQEGKRLSLAWRKMKADAVLQLTSGAPWLRRAPLRSSPAKPPAPSAWSISETLSPSTAVITFAGRALPAAGSGPRRISRARSAGRRHQRGTFGPAESWHGCSK